MKTAKPNHSANSDSVQNLSKQPQPGQVTDLVVPNLELLAKLVRVHALTEPSNLFAVLKNEHPDSAKLNEILIGIREIVNGVQSTSELSELKPLKPNTYVMPFELREIAPQVQELLKSKLSNESYGYCGLMLVGEKGTGKSEFPRYLAQQLGQQVGFWNVDVSAIRNSPAPGSKIAAVLRELQAKAVKEGRFQVVLFDEGDLLFSPFSAVETTKTVEEDSSNSGRRQTNHSRREETSSATIDAVGNDILSALKSALGESLSRVFPIITTNRTQIPSELNRPGRLQRIEFKPIGLKTFTYDWNGNESYLKGVRYEDLRRVLPFVIDIMNAQEVRLSGKNNPHLVKLKATLATNLAGLPTYEQYKESAKVSAPNKNINFNVELNTIALETILRELAFPITFSREVMRYVASKIGFTEIPHLFTGTRQHQGFSPTHEVHDLPQYFPELLHLQQATAAQVALYYKQNREQFRSYETARQSIGRYVLPQLASYDFYKAAAQQIAEK